MSLVKQVRFGATGLKISPIVVGCMSYGSKTWAPWVLEDEEEVFKILKYCYDIGLRTFDTADVYSNGRSERLLGKFLKVYNIRRETVVILSKVRFPVDESLGLSLTDVFALSEANALELANQGGLSRKHILAGAAQSVERLGTYIDVLQIHRVDPETPVEETMRALNDVVEKGLTRYIGASSMLGTEFAEMQHVAESHGWVKFVSWQSQYNLMYREDEREVIPYTKKHGIALVPWSPNRRGALTRPLGEQTDRSMFDKRLQNLSKEDKEIIGRVEVLSKKKGVSMAALSTAWVLSKGCWPIVGLSSVNRVKDIHTALSVKLTEEDTKFLEEPYVPKFLE